MRKCWLFLFIFSSSQLLSQTPINVLLQDGHAGNISTMRISHNDKYLVTGSQDNTVIVWDVRTGRQLTKIEEHRNEILRVRVDNSAKHVISLDGGYDIIGNQVSRLIVTETGSWRRRLVIDSIRHQPDVITYGNQFFIIYQSGSNDDPKIDSVQVFSFSNYDHLLTTDSTGFHSILEKAGYKKAEQTVQLLPVGRQIYLQQKGTKNIRLDLGNDSCANGLKPAFSSYYKDYDIRSDAQKIVLVDYCDRIFVVSLNDGKLIRSWQGANIDRIQFNASAEFLFLTSRNEIQLASVKEAETVLTYKGLLRPISSIAADPKKKNAFAFSQDSLWKKIDLSRPASLRSFNGHKGYITSMAYSADGKLLATGATDPAIFLWDLEKNEKIKSIDPSRLKPTGEDILVTGPEYYLPNYLKFIKNDRGDLLFVTLYNKGFLWQFNKDTYRQFPIEKGFFEMGDNILLSKSGNDSAVMLLQQEQVEFTFPAPHIFNNRGEQEYPKLLAAATDTATRLVILGGKNSVDIWRYSLDGKKEKLQTLSGCTRPVRWLRLSKGGQKLLLFCLDNTFRIYRNDGRKFHVVLDTILSPVTAVHFLDGGHEFVTSHQKGYVTAWDSVGKPRHTAYFFADGNYILRIPGNYYMSSRSSLRGMSFEVNGRVFSPDQFDHIYNRPDKVLEYIGHSDTAMIASLRNAYAKRIKRLNISTANERDVLNGPVTEILNSDSIHYQQYSPDLKLRITVKDPVSTVQKINVWTNEVPLFGSGGLTVSSGQRQLDTVIQITLGKGKNWIEVSATNTRGVESLRMPLFVNNADSANAPSRLYFIGIGINRFNQKGHDLNWSVKDIRDLAKKLKEKYHDRIVIDTLFDKDVTIKNVKALREKLLTTSIDDKVILAYSGHGLLSEKFDYYLSTYPVDFNDPAKDGLPYEELEGLMDGIPSRNKLMLIDACHSGEVDKEEMERYDWFEKNAGDSTARSDRKPVLKNDNLGMQNSFELMQELFMNVSRSTGTTVISAAAGTQFAQESGKLQNGVFTFAILEYMDQHPETTVSELRAYVNKRVLDLTKGLQVPTTRTETRLVDWRVW